MNFFILALLVLSAGCFAQNKTTSPSTFKGDHYALYTKCFSAIAFCEITQQTYTSCGSVKNCYGLYVLPGDTFYVNIEDKNQVEVISADISFGGYLPAVSGFTFQPIDNNCIPQQALQITIPLTAVPGSSFQIVNQNIAYVNNTTDLPSTPLPYDIYVGGLQPSFTVALSDFTVCPVIPQVSVSELVSSAGNVFISPNPTTDKIQIAIKKFQKPLSYKLVNLYGKVLKSGTLKHNENELLVDDLKADIYFISFYLEERLIETKKMIVTNSGH